MTALADRTWTELEATEAVLVIPLGATEQHGPHLPLSTDTDIAAALAQRLAQARPDVVTAPAMPYGSSGEHGAFAGTLSIGQEAIELVVVELVRSATQTFGRVLLICAHGGNEPAVTRAVQRLRGEDRDVWAWSPARVWEGDAHAGHIETSVMLALDPARVHADRAVPGATRPLAALLPALRERGVAAVSDNGILGDPTGADAAEGERLLARATAALAGVVDDWPAGPGAWA